MQGIYMIKNKINNKIYIGSSININNRWNQHKSSLLRGVHKSRYFQNSYNKHGIENFEFSVMEIIDNQSQLLIREQYYLNLYKPYERDNGYNIDKSAEHSRLGMKHTKETKEKISKIFKGRKLSENHRKNVIKSLIGREKSEETRGKIGLKNRKFNEECVVYIIELYKQGKTYQEIADIMGCVKTTIYELFKKLFSEGKVIKRSEIIKNEVIKLLQSNLSQKEIANRLNVSESTITRIKKGGIINEF
jgi:group I intron endonuclease